jgi:bacterioferritin
MQGNKKIIDLLNENLANELTAIHQYIVHAGMCGNWGYTDLEEYIINRAKGEMKHSHMLIDRILFLESLPVTNVLNPINIGLDVPEMFENDHEAEMTAITGYNEAIEMCSELKDNDTRTLLESILNDETSHIDEIEQNMAQIKQIGIQGYLAEQV